MPYNISKFQVGKVFCNGKFCCGRYDDL